MEYISNLDCKFLLKFAKEFFKQYYNSDNVLVEKMGNSCMIKCRVNNKHNLVILLKDFSVTSNDILCGQLAKIKFQKALINHYGDIYLNALKEFIYKCKNDRYNKSIRCIDGKINRIEKEVTR